MFRDEKSERLAEAEEAHRQRERELPPDHLLAYRREINRRVKDPDTYAVLVYGIGFGLHHFYLGRFGLFLLDLICGIVFWVSIIQWFLTGEGLPILISILAIGYNIYDTIYCLMFSQRIVREYNLDLSKSALERHTTTGS